MRKTLFALFATLIAMATFAAPASADALVRIGVDGRWIPYSVESIEVNSNDVDLDIERSLKTWGIGARALIGPDVFALGVKANFVRHSFKVSELNYSEVTLNGMARIGIPSAPIAIFVEGGLLLSFDYVDLGYNVGGGIEYNIQLAPPFDFNLGVGAQYANGATGTELGDRDIEDLRLFAFLGFDFTI